PIYDGALGQWQFRAWNIETCTTSGPCSLPITGIRQVIATWHARLSLQINGLTPPNGWVSTDSPHLECGLGHSPCSSNLDRPSTIWVTAHPNPGYHLDYWTGVA